MALTKVTYAASNDVNKYDRGLGITPKPTYTNLNAIQDEIIANAASIATEAANVDVLQSNNSIRTIDGSTGQKACSINGVTLITGGTGIADLTLAAPASNSHIVIRLASISSGSVVITTATGVTFDGTNNTCTMNATDDWIELVYVSATAWGVVRSNSVSLSSV
jgi:hypothetical protein